MKQSEIEEMIDESFNYLIDTIINFPENPYHINFEKIFFRGKANLIHKFEKIIEKKDKQIDLMADLIYEISKVFPGTVFYALTSNGFDLSKCDGRCQEKLETCKDCIKQYFERKVEYVEN